MKILQLILLTGCLMLIANVSAQVFMPVGQSVGLSTDLKATFGNPIWGDMNNDGYIDLIVPHHGNTPDIYINNQDGTFRDQHIILTFGAEYFDEHNDFHGYSFTDFNNDKILDLFITMGSKQGDPEFTKRDLLYQGNGNGSFELVSTAAGVENPTGRGRSSCWFDYNGDGDLDFFLKNVDTPNAFYLNTGSGTFTDIAESIGLIDLSLGAVCSLVDYDNDGLMDILLTAGNLDDTLLRQLPDGTFSDVTSTAGIAPIEHGRGVAWGDYNNDGFMDLYIARAAPSSYTGMMSALELSNNLYINNGDGTFTDNTTSVGLGGSFNTNAAAWGDVNSDGFLDLFVVNAGEVDGSDNYNFLYINNGDGTFTESAAQLNIDGQADLGEHRYTSASFGDYDNDGALDIILDGSGFGQNKGTAELYHNEGNSNNYLKVKLKGVKANAPAIGSVVRVASSSLVQVRQYTGATSGALFSQSLQPIHFGVGLESAVSIDVVWPKSSGEVNQSVTNLAINQTVVLQQGRSIVRGRASNINDAGCYVWRNNQGWNLRCIGRAGQRIKFTGSITSNGAFTSVKKLRLEPNDVVASDSDTINFELYATQGHDTVIFTTTGDTVTFDIYQDGTHQPKYIRIGEHSVLPASLPVILSE